MIMENNTVPLVELQDVSARVKLGNGEWLPLLTLLLCYLIKVKHTR